MHSKSRKRRQQGNKGERTARIINPKTPRRMIRLRIEVCSIHASDSLAFYWISTSHSSLDRRQTWPKSMLILRARGLSMFPNGKCILKLPDWVTFLFRRVWSEVRGPLRVVAATFIRWKSCFFSVHLSFFCSFFLAPQTHQRMEQAKKVCLQKPKANATPNSDGGKMKQ